METAIEFGLMVLGFVFAVWWFSVIILPILYGFPRALWWCGHGKAKWRVPFIYLVSPVIWTAIFLGISLVLMVYFSPTADYLMSSKGFAVGQTLGLVLIAAKTAFSKSTHRDMDADFRDFAQRYSDAVPSSSQQAESTLENPTGLEAIVRDFGATIENIYPLTYYDTSTLPHPKDSIVKAILFALSTNENQQLRQHLVTGLNLLAQFQDGVGPVPVSRMPVDVAEINNRLQAGEISDKEAAAMIAAAGNSVDQEKLKRLDTAYNEEVQRFNELAHAATVL